MKNYFIAIAFIFISTLELNAQSDFRKGYIINNEKDTIHGFINYQANLYNSTECVFKKEKDSKKQIFKPFEIHSYKFTDSKYYISKNITNNNTVEQVFLEYIINGIVNVYYYRDSNGEHYLIEDKDGILRELHYKEKESIVNGTRYFRKNKQYIGVLKNIFKDSPTTIDKVNTIKLNRKSLIKISQNYHNDVCNDRECIIYEKKITKRKKSFGLIVGYNGLALSKGTVPIDYSYLADSDFSFETFPSFGFYYKKNLPNKNERLYIQYEVTYSYLKLSSHTVEEHFSNSTEIYNTEIKQQYLNSLVLMKYEFPSGKIRPTFQLGGFLRLNLGTDHVTTRELRITSNNTLLSESIYSDNLVEAFDYGVNAGIGLKGFYIDNKEILLDLRYQRGVNFIEGFSPNVFSLNLGFQLWGN